MSDKVEISTETKANLSRLEALLFAAPGLSSVEELAKSLELSPADVVQLTQVLARHYEENHGIRLQKVRNQYQLVTAAEHAQLIEQFLGLEVSSRLSQPALEVLAIIAYRLASTRPEIEAIRGVNSDTVVKSLLAKGLIEEKGRSEAPGRPILYGVAVDFLQHFGLESLEQLPEIDIEALKAVQPSDGTQEQRILKD
ncbi:MAG: SMC-Scp complex subunit ScpB [Anaerolineaceae bacterium]